MILNIVVILWGDGYIENFTNWALPALLAPGNIPALAEMSGLDCRFLVLSHMYEAEKIQSSYAYQQLIRVLPTEICPLPDWDYTGPACAAQNVVQRYVLDQVRRNEESILFCSPDVIWTDGSLAHVGRELLNGRTAIFIPSYRVTEETIKHDLISSGILAIDSIAGGRLLMRHAHPLLGAFHYASAYCPRHIEYVTWPVGQEGVMMYHLARAPDCFIPHRLSLTDQELISDNNAAEEIYSTQNSYQALGLSLTPLTQCSNWILRGRPSSTKIFGQFMARHHASLYGLLDPVKVPCVASPDEELWLKEVTAGSEFMGRVLRDRDAVLSGLMGHEEHLNIPQSYNTKLNPNDCEFYARLLQWVPGDCVTIRLLQRMAGDGW